jgi:hypothetical protein
MRRIFAVVVFAGIAGMCVSSLSAAGRPSTAEREHAAPAPVAVQRVTVPPSGLRDEAAMVLIGTALIGLAAAVRRAA